MTNDYGKITEPLSMADAISYELIAPGHTVYIRAGTYSGTWVNQLVGTAGNRITIKPYNNERVILSGGWSDAAAQYVDYIDLELTTTRDPAEAYSQTKTHDFSGTGVRIINCILHDSHGGGFWDNADLCYGTLSYNHGVVNGGTAYGHGLYTQNQTASHKKTIKHSVFGRSANYGLHVYATQFNAENVDILENVFLPGSSHLVGSQNSDNDILFDGNHGIGGVSFGYGSHEHTDLTYTNNTMHNPSGIVVFNKNWLSGSATGNLLVSGVSGEAERDLVQYVHPASPCTFVYNNNTYYNRSGKAACFAEDGIGWKTLAQWRTAYGFDVDSTITLDGSSPADSSHVYPNEYASVSKRKGMVVIWNWSGANTVDVDLSDIAIDAGAEFSVINTQNPLVDIATVTMPVGKVVTFAMTGHTIAGVTGWADPPSIYPTMGAFILEYVPA